MYKVIWNINNLFQSRTRMLWSNNDLMAALHFFIPQYLTRTEKEKKKKNEHVGYD